MDAEKLATNHILQIPTVMGAVVPIVNIPGVASDELKLTGELLADIYAGKITKWNDPKLVELNRGVKLPSLAIAPVFRADASGTSYVFTSYLSAVSPDWKKDVGANTSVKWPAGAGAKGNDGVAGTVKNTRGGIGYVENAYATQNKLTTTQLRNKAGDFVKPTMTSFTAAAASADWAGAKNFAVSLVDQGGATSWPIVSATFLLLPEDPKDPAPGRQRGEVRGVGLPERRPDRIEPRLHPVAQVGAGYRAREDQERREVVKSRPSRLAATTRQPGFCRPQEFGPLSQATAHAVTPSRPASAGMGDALFAFAARASGLLVLVFARRDHRHAVHRRPARLPRFRPGLPDQHGLGSGPKHLRRRRLHLRHLHHRGLGAVDGRAGRFRDRLLPDGAGAERPCAARSARRSSCWPQSPRSSTACGASS